MGEEHAYKYFTTKYEGPEYKGQDLVVRWHTNFSPPNMKVPNIKVKIL
jgi:hypothetical protein